MITSKTQKGVRDWSVKAKRDEDDIVVTVKVGKMFHSRVNLSAATWPKDFYEQRQVATRALEKAMNLPEIEWSSELSRIPHEIVKAVAEVVC